MTGPYRVVPAEVRRSNVSNVRTALVVLAGIVVGVIAAVGIAFAFGLFERPAPTPRVAPRRAPRVDALATVPRTLDAGASLGTVRSVDAAPGDAAPVDAARVPTVDAAAASTDAAAADDAPVATEPGADGDATAERPGRRHRRHRRHHRR